MKIFIDIGHPAHVHYYKNFIRIMESKGHEIFVTARDREFVKELLENENIKYINRGRGANSIMGKIIMALKIELTLLRYAIKFKPNIFLGHSNTYVALVSFFMRKPCIFTDDTDSTSALKYKLPFVSVVLSPSCFRHHYGKKHKYFDSFMELMYLHPKYFYPNHEIVKKYIPDNDKSNVLIRFVSWEAHHDKNLTGIPNNIKRELIKELEPYCNIFISSEKKLEHYFEKYQVRIPPYLIHDFMSLMDFMVGESATMASESAMLGIPAIFFDSKGRGYTDEQEKEFGLVQNIKNYDDIVCCSKRLVKNTDSRQAYRNKLGDLLRVKIDPTAYLVWFVENYPFSFEIIKDDPNYQDNFRYTDF